MCGRAVYNYDQTTLELKELGVNSIELKFTKNFNLSPTEDIPVLFFDNHSNNFKTESGLWWLIPPWLQKIDIKKAGATFNARGESIFHRKSFQSAATHRRCEVILSGFIEWQYLDRKQKRPYLIQRVDKSPLNLAAIYSVCDNRKTISILTVKANNLMKNIHNRWKFDNQKDSRMPLPLVDEDRKIWHDTSYNNQHGIQKIIDSYHCSDKTHLEAFRIDTQIGSPHLKNESFLKPVDGAVFSNISPSF